MAEDQKTEVEFLKDVIAEDKKRPWHDHFVVGASIAGILVGVTIGALDQRKIHSLERLAQQHIKIVTATDKNCNDCHLGASFVNLFNHPVVKGDDNTIILMMDKAKIKRW